MQFRVDSWSNKLVVRESAAGKDVAAEAKDVAGIRSQATTAEDIADCEGFAYAVVRSA